jgi:hypothetical protein
MAGDSALVGGSVGVVARGARGTIAGLSSGQCRLPQLPWSDVDADYDGSGGRATPVMRERMNDPSPLERGSNCPIRADSRGAHGSIYATDESNRIWEPSAAYLKWNEDDPWAHDLIRHPHPAP